MLITLSNWVEIVVSLYNSRLLDNSNIVSISNPRERSGRKPGRGYQFRTAIYPRVRENFGKV
jgi:hypothetical protein